MDYITTTDQTAFDETARALNEDRPKFLSGFCKKFFDGGSESNPVSEPLLEWARSVAMQSSLFATHKQRLSRDLLDFLER